MKTLLILGAGTAGTMVANRLSRLLDLDEWRIQIVDQCEMHYYQPGFLFIPFGIYSNKDVVRPKRDFIPAGIDFIISAIDVIEPDKNRVILSDGRQLAYDFLVIATGCRTSPQDTTGLKENEWQKSIHEFYTLDGAVELFKCLQTWQGGRLVVNVVENPIKCPPAPLEFLMLADWFFQKQGIRNKVELTFATPLSGAFTKPVASKHLGYLLEKKGIKVVPDFVIERADPDARKIISYDDQEVEYDLLVTVPLNRGDDLIRRSGLGDELDFIQVDKHTLIMPGHDNVFVLGDAAAIPASKAGSAAHFAARSFSQNFIRFIDGQELLPTFDGHSNCFVESGFGKALMINFNYQGESKPGPYPLPWIGPFNLYHESSRNHWGKLIFHWVYWNLMLKGRDLPLMPYQVES